MISTWEIFLGSRSLRRVQTSVHVRRLRRVKHASSPRWVSLKKNGTRPPKMAGACRLFLEHHTGLRLFLGYRYPRNGGVFSETRHEQLSFGSSPSNKKRTHPPCAIRSIFCAFCARSCARDRPPSQLSVCSASADHLTSNARVSANLRLSCSVTLEQKGNPFWGRQFLKGKKGATEQLSRSWVSTPKPEAGVWKPLPDRRWI